MLTSEQLKAIRERWMAGDVPFALVHQDIPALLDTVEGLSQDRDRLRDMVLHDSESMAAVFSILRASGLGDYHSMTEGVQALASKTEELRGLLAAADIKLRMRHTYTASDELLDAIEEALKWCV
jgi:hypothetical protein